MLGKYTDLLEAQLCIDYHCTLEEIRSEKNIFRTLQHNPVARPIGVNSLLKMAVYNEKLLVMADERLLEWCQNTFGKRKGT